MGGHSGTSRWAQRNHRGPYNREAAEDLTTELEARVMVLAGDCWFGRRRTGP